MERDVAPALEVFLPMTTLYLMKRQSVKDNYVDRSQQQSDGQTETLYRSAQHEGCG